MTVMATSSDAETARMNDKARGPTKCPCTLEVSSSGMNTAMTTAVA